MTVNASVAGRDLGSTTADVAEAISSLGKFAGQPEIVIRGREPGDARNPSSHLPQDWSWDRAGLPPDGREFSVLVRAFYHYDGDTGGSQGVLWMLIATGTTITSSR